VGGFFFLFGPKILLNILQEIFLKEKKSLSHILSFQKWKPQKSKENSKKSPHFSLHILLESK
jgi:hypothetical protein